MGMPEIITLDDSSSTPVNVEIFSVNANGQHTSNENELSLAARISCGGESNHMARHLRPSLESWPVESRFGMAPP